MKFVFIAVNYNGATHTENYLQSLQEAAIPAGDTLEAVIVDNKSAAEDLERVKVAVARRTFARLIELNHNPGYFRGLNSGIDTCTKDGETLLIVGNNDLRFDPDFMAKLKEIPYKDDVMVIAPNIITLEGRRQNPHVIDRVPTLELIKARIYFSNYYIGQAGRYVGAVFKTLMTAVLPPRRNRKPPPAPGRMKIKRGIGACYVLTPYFFRHHERLDDRIFLWGEEALLSHQVESVNGSTLYDPTIRITHCESASVRFIERRDRYEIGRTSYMIYRQYL